MLYPFNYLVTLHPTRSLPPLFTLEDTACKYDYRYGTHAQFIIIQVGHARSVISGHLFGHHNTYVQML